MKFFLCFGLILTLACVTLANQPVKWGKGKGDKLLYRIDVERAAIQGFAHDIYVDSPRDEENGTNEEIVDIWVYDKNPSSQKTLPVFAYSVDKDLSERVEAITVILRGQPSSAINSTVEFYGKK
ncbi:uncharacterized protein LOC135962087 [Calliphora vicina]|uniref:uncharacterized protein LOC135962087 n=1 Tax=Calliphora vicina TaxID=7373 RepID=UPI00325BAF0F